MRFGLCLSILLVAVAGPVMAQTSNVRQLTPAEHSKIVDVLKAEGVLDSVETEAIHKGRTKEDVIYTMRASPGSSPRPAGPSACTTRTWPTSAT